ncbi:hypothetical protein SMI01S_12070 [Sphingobacterium mizutaii NBRC 14946 = DSM 11724]|uniref:Uncharacterized protein n=2 Tax=Sphingobacterium mizutaii TaxID=1010 RepID=A0AAJ4XDX2_9SPHI|nr:MULTISPECIES: hypothetical protein [Sphingobacterium]GEM67601.1 hypothetical protein SMI01S_12070 [Sphingobacterium mizutaii NBRC 14946 = DSM 11724]SDL15056.1 hypothetical protein SAMN05192578_1011541 [Sphingobacterium mizutaii]SNV52298.1 Uncharacterised protein [Sphingobacterium mizutaii]
MNATQEVNVIKTAEYKPWSQKLAEMEVESTMLVDMRSASTVRGIISARMPIYFPEMIFETKKIKVKVDGKETPVIEVFRKA